MRPAARQARSRRTRRVLLDAGLRLLEEQGPEALTIAAVSAEAGVAPGTVYRRFGDKEGLLDELQQEFTVGFGKEAARRMSRSALSADVPPQVAIDVAVHAMADTFSTHQRLLRVFVLLGIRDDHVAEGGRRASHEGGRLFRDLLWPYRAAFTRPDAEHAIDVAHRLVYTACMHRVLFGANMESPTSMSWAELSDELSRTVALYLLGALPDP